MRKKINIALIIGLIIILILPFLQNYILKQNQDSIDFNSYSKEKLVANRERGDKTYSPEKIKAIDLNGVILNREQADLTKIIGQLVIPSINKNIVIFDGLENNALYHGAATMKPHQKMGAGNYAIAGHYCDDKDILFGGVVDLKEGEIIKLTDKNKIYFYRIFKTAIVNETQVDIIEDSYQKVLKRNMPILSLMTCYYNEPGKRFFVFAELYKTEPYNVNTMLRGLKK